MAFGVNTKLTAILDALTSIDAHLFNVDSNTSAMAGSISDLNAAVTDLSAYLNTAIGTFGEAEAGTILYALRNIQECICQLAGGSDPSGASPNGCDAPTQSLTGALILSEDYPGRAWVQWDCATPQGINCQHYLTPELPSGVELFVSAPAPFDVWVQSTCPVFSASPDDGHTYPTNEWVTFPGETNLAISVDAGCRAIAFICTDPSTGFIDCIQRDSSVTEHVTASSDGVSRVRLSVPLDGLGLPMTDTITVSGVIFTTDQENTWVASDANGVTFEWIDGDFIRVWWHEVGGGYNTHNLDSTHTSYGIAVATDLWGVDNWQDPVGDITKPFTVRICPPTPE